MSSMTDDDHLQAIPTGRGMPSLLGARAWQALAALGAGAVLAGVIVLIWPGPTLLVIGALFGIYLLVSGIFQLAGAFGRHVPASLRALGFLSGAISIVLGLICFRGPMETIVLLGIWIGVSWILQGVTETMVAASADLLPRRGWHIFFGIISVIAGATVIAAPVSSLATLAVFAGVWLVVVGVVQVARAIMLRAH